MKFINYKGQLPEGLIYYDGYLLWVDILVHKIYRHKLNLETSENYVRNLNREAIDQLPCNLVSSSTEEWDSPAQYPSTIIPIENKSQNAYYLITCQDGIYKWSPISTEPICIYKSKEIESACTRSKSKSKIRFNDGKCDPYGNLIIGTLDMLDRPNRAGLYRFRTQLHGTNNSLEKISNASLSNGIGWSYTAAKGETKNQRMYYIDTPERTVQVFAYDENGIGDLLSVIDLAEYDGFPDGLTVTDDGMIWVAMWDGAQILKIDSFGRVVQQIKLPVSRPTISAIIGNFIYIANSLREGEDLSGSILKVPLDSNTQSLPITPFCKLVNK